MLWIPSNCSVRTVLDTHTHTHTSGSVSIAIAMYFQRLNAGWKTGIRFVVVTALFFLLRVVTSYCLCGPIQSAWPIAAGRGVEKTEWRYLSSPVRLHGVVLH